MDVATADRYRANWQDEIDSAALYRAIAAVESNASLAELYRRLAAVEERHAQVWEDRLRAGGVHVPPRRVGWRSRALAWLAKRFGPAFVVPTLDGLEQADRNGYAGQPETTGTTLAADEHSHARLLRQVASGGVEGGVLARFEGRHRASSGGNALRAAVLGANDGLLSNFSLVMGVAGAALANQTILITGLAGLLAGAGSMAMGEWISVQSSRELYGRQLAIEEREILEAPEEEAEELALIYQAKGLDEAQARALAERLLSDQATALATLAREELAIDPAELGGSAWEAAATSFTLFAVGAIVPVLPFLWLSGNAAVIVSAAASAAGLFAIGAAITLFTGRGVLFSGLRQVLVGAAAAALTYSLGRLLGVTLGG
jgi:VIT1/CCC1 family predicted Fe2+/Mn2+ transporter